MLRETAEILYVDDDIAVVIKPGGMVVHPNQYDRKTPALVNTLSGKLHGKVYPVHRLDKQTSGVMVFGRTKNAAREISRQFADGLLSKRYAAVIAGELESEAEVNVPVRPGNSSGEKVPATSIISPGGVLVQEGELLLSLADIELVTGKTHQARIHCEVLGKPIIGDRQHGWKQINRAFLESRVAANFLQAVPETVEIPEDAKKNFVAEDRAFISELLDQALFLRSMELKFTHPVSGASLYCRADVPLMWRAIFGNEGFATAGMIPEAIASGIRPEALGYGTVFLDEVDVTGQGRKKMLGS